MPNLRNMTSIYLTCNNKILLLYRQGSTIVNNMWISSAGGHFEKEELNNPKACILRELYEELNISENMLENMALRYITLRYTQNEIRQNYYYFAELKNGTELKLSSNEGLLKWFSFDELNGLEMPFSAKYALDHWLCIGQYTTAIYGGTATETAIVFTELFKS